MEIVTNILAEILLKRGKLLEYGDTYYRYNQSTSKIEKSDYTLEEWEETDLVLEEVSQGEDRGWRYVE